MKNFKFYGLSYSPLSFKATVEVPRGFKFITKELSMPLSSGIWFFDDGNQCPLSVEALASEWFQGNQDIIKGVLTNAKICAY